MLEYDNVHRLSDGKVSWKFILVFLYFYPSFLQLRDRDREQLKESFSAINSAIDSVRQQCQEYIVSDVDLRERLRIEGKLLIMDMYKNYFNKFANKDFTRNREKYVRYEPKVLESIIDNFFENRL